MQILQYYFKNLNYNCVNKFNYNSIECLPKINKFVIIFKNKIPDLKIIAISLVIIQFITKKKACITTSKKQNLLLKIRKGAPIGCKIILNKKYMFLFLKKLIFNKILFLKNTKLHVNHNIVTLVLKSVFKFKNSENFYSVFNVIKNLNIIMQFKKVNSKQKTIFILKHYFHTLT